MDKVVCSVPYSGTRSLMKYLGIDRYEHFGSSPSFFARDDFTAHIPVRNPMHVARSWAMRGKPLDELLMRYKEMIKFISSNNNHVLYCTEDLPVVVGNGEWTEKHAAVAEYQEAIMKMVDQLDG